QRQRQHPRQDGGVAENPDRGLQPDLPPRSLPSTDRSASDSPLPIWATKWLSTASASPPSASASRIRRALYSSLVAVAVYRYAFPSRTRSSHPLRCRLSMVLITVV